MTATDSKKLVDAYIEAQDTRFQPHLKRIREIIREEAPQTEELISYQIPCFKHHHMLVGYGASKADCVSFYTMSPALVKSMQQELADIPHAGATLHLSLDEPLPEELTRRIIRARIEENEERAISEIHKKK